VRQVQSSSPPNTPKNTTRVDLDRSYRFLFKRQVGAILSRKLLARRLFDPLGFLGPIIVVAKIILQELWQAGCQWDESVPQTIHSRWLKLKWQLPKLSKLRISRCVKFASDPRFVQIHEFYDASQRAYGACIYLNGGHQ